MASKVFVIAGPSGVGEGTLIRELLKAVRGLELFVSATTRKPREKEIDGRDYHFLTPVQFEQRKDEGDFLEFATCSGNLYGTLRSGVERRLEAGHSVVLEVGIQAAQQVRASGIDSVQIFIASPDAAVRRERLEVAEQQLAAQVDFDHCVVNDEVGRAAAELVAIVRSEADPAPAGRSSRLPGR